MFSMQAGYFFDTKLIKEYNYICNADWKKQSQSGIHIFKKTQ